MKIHTIPVLQDNYCYIIESGGHTSVVDPGESAPVMKWLGGRALDTIMLTHHHDDHTGGAAALKRQCGARIIGPAADSHRIPDMDVMVQDGDTIKTGDTAFRIIATPGHTRGHICYYSADAHAVFTADTLFSLGCGRLFEGTAHEMWDSLQKIAALPDETLVYCGHEYTAANARFALTIEPENIDLRERAAAVTALRAAGLPTVPVRLGLEKKTNPFLRAGSAARFAALRLAKDNA
jgi:hydroxyacylglutathione hydrolase